MIWHYETALLLVGGPIVVQQLLFFFCRNFPTLMLSDSLRQNFSDNCILKLKTWSFRPEFFTDWVDPCRVYTIARVAGEIYRGSRQR